MSVPHDYEFDAASSASSTPSTSSTSSAPTPSAASPTAPASPDEHLAHLLGRALNSFELPDETLHRLESALAYSGSLHSAHHSAGRHRETYRHTWLLADGSALTLWELVHNTGRDRSEQHEVYVTEEELHLATGRLPLPPEATPDFDLQAPLASVLLPAVPAERRRFGPADPDSSVDHARRLLRRAENPDAATRPGPGTARLLREACAHQITQAFGRRVSQGFALYEHAFLLRDGGEISLWEVEHTVTPDGRHMCEVYATQDAAREAIEHRAASRRTSA
ncbi:DUF6227 family protein [Streptomyces kunmingensis]|uniref:DUF6227 family protein n=1 Tax=Streptomyces kunmingensis TaxID=68225 RepID=A0ABU6CGF5_9ACTN|nr:DUF6227 family protein [Streptomyces kunmingensis]MEB3963702.1 DUF6227 family protein [Streptomyces kunmingensis]